MHNVRLSQLPLVGFFCLSFLGACGDEEMSTSTPLSAGPVAGGAAPDICPALPLSGLCKKHGDGDPLGDCPSDSGSFLKSYFDAPSGLRDGASVVSQVANGGGGRNVTVQILQRGETEYYFDDKGALLGARTRSYTVESGCELGQRYGQSCAPLDAGISSACGLGLGTDADTSVRDR